MKNIYNPQFSNKGIVDLSMCIALYLYFTLPSFAQGHDHTHDIGSEEEKYYRIVTVEIPDNIKLEVSGLAELPDQRIAVSTRMGELWIIENAAMNNNSKPVYKLFASGLHTPLGLAYRDKAFYVAQRSELTKITDTNSDDIAVNFETIATWPLSGNYC